MPDLKNQIVDGLRKIDLSVNEEQIEKINDFVNLLYKWNKAYNLTAVRDINEMLEKHIVDSLSIFKYINGNRIIDVGTGPGLPGIPLAIIFPEKKFVLLDSNGKKTRFLQQAKTELHLNNIEIVNDRVDQYKPEKLFDEVLSRAFSSIDEMLSNTEHLCKEDGYFLAMKGQYPETELQLVKKPYKVQAIRWPESQAERHLVIISQSSRG